jgi:tetratricopeptide (TPR) repeat protein
MHPGHFLSHAMMLLAPLAALAGPSPAGTPDGEITMLEPVFVEASSGNPWQYFSLPGYEVVSHCPDNFNATYARALQVATAARLALLPADFWGEIPTPVKIVLYNREPSDPNRLNRERPIDLSWGAQNGAILGSDTVQLSYPVTVGDGDTFINCGNYWNLEADTRGFCVDPDSGIRIGCRVPQFPAWFVAGLEGPCGLYADRLIHSTATGEVMVLSNAFWISTAETVAIQKRAREKPRDREAPRPVTLLPLGRLFGGATPEDQAALWNSETALLVRWGLFGSGKREAFLDFVRQSAREPVTERLFERCLGLSYAEAQGRLAAYLPVAATEPIAVPVSAPPEEPLRIREATSTEIARIIGDWGRLEGRTTGLPPGDYQRECLDQADRLFERTFATHRADPLFLAAFGLYAVQAGDLARAREALEAAAGAGVVRPRAYLELARLRLNRSLPFMEQGIGDLTPADYSGILGLLTTARTQMPSLLGTYELLARVLEHAPQRPAPEDLSILDRALGLFPANAALAYRVATLYRRLGNPDRAEAIVDRARGFAETDEGRTLLSGFRAKMVP